MEERHLEQDDKEYSEKGDGSVFDGRPTTERRGQVTDRDLDWSLAKESR
jgi:hypothetical protein